MASLDAALVDSLPRAQGRWIDEGIFLTKEGKPCFAICYLRNPTGFYAFIDYYLWYDWLRRPCPDLDPNVNDGKCRAFLVPSQGNPTKPEVLVWLQDDVEVIRKRREGDCTELRRKRETAPGRTGKWLSEKTWQSDEWGECLRGDELAKQIGRSKQFIVYHRRRIQKALGGRKPWSDRIPQLSGTRRVVVSSLNDFLKIVEWDAQHRQCHNVVSADWKSAAELTQGFGCKTRDQKIELSFALKRFRTECPQYAAQDSSRDEDRNRDVHTWRNDPVAFSRWLNGRTIKDAAAPVRRSSRQTWNKRLQVAVRFLQFVLTHGAYGPRKFQEFLHNPPAGPLVPYGEVDREQIIEWAKEARIETSKMLKAAKKTAGVQHKRIGFQGKGGCVWFLDKPVKIDVPGTRSTRQGSAARITEPLKPRWDCNRRELWFGTQLCIRYKRLPLSQGLILASFEELEWPARIDDPLPRGTLKDTLNNLRKTLGKDSAVVFSGDGTGKGINWKRR